MRLVIKAGLIGVAVTVILVAGAFIADASGFPAVARSLFWQNGLLQSLVPLGNIGTPERPVYEGSPLNLLAFMASIPLGFAIYGSLAYVALKRRWRGT
jgi:hypothetical protein